jgi:hypothetical protein
MSTLQDSSDRPVSDYVFFAVGFAGVMSTAYGVVGTSVPITVIGLSLLGVSVGVFFLKMLLSSE